MSAPPAIIAFDIETSALPLEKLQSILPPWNPDSVGPHPGEFDPKNVKLGRMTDEVKIAATIEAAQQKHMQAIVDYHERKDNGEANYWAKIQEDAALSPITGQVCAIGYQGQKTQIHTAVGDVSEEHLLTQFWKVYRSARAAHKKMVGFNIKAFDVPFLARRSWMLGVEVPKTILTPTNYLDSLFIDLREIWGVGYRGSDKPGFGTLDTIAKALGLQGKPDDCTGAGFAKMLWSDDPADREKAIRYLEGDLRIVVEVAERLGV
jgi:hypothetical protein